MMMNDHVLRCFIFLALVKNLTSNPPFELDGNALTVKEGSCIKLTCRVTYSVSASNAYWFWMKDPQWIEAYKNYSATIVYSTNNVTRPVSPEFSGRVHYVGSPSEKWNNPSHTSPPQCSILICNLNKNDSGQYKFRFIGADKWSTKMTTTVTVTDNPCPITFENQPPVKENDTITLTCSTLSSCSSSPQITDLSNLHSTKLNESKTHKSVSFTASWQDDGRAFSCQDPNNSDKYLMRNVSVTVEYAPKGISSAISKNKIKEGDSVTLTCSAKGNPPPTFTWFRTNVSSDPDTVASIAEWEITSITEKHSGQYYCQAENKYGKLESNVTIDVHFKPEVEIKMLSPATVTEGDTVTLSCNLKRSNPQPWSYVWYKDETRIGTESESKYVLKVSTQDRGFYKCGATNTEGTGTSDTVQIVVQYRPRKPKIVSEETVKVGGSLTLTCVTDAYPAPHSYYWYHYNNNQQTDSLRRTFRNDKSLTLKNVQRADEGCYTCNCTNSISSGPKSDEKCIKVLYPPTVPVLSMASEVTENQTVAISCSAESYPEPTLSLTRSTSNNQPLEVKVLEPRSGWYQFNQLNYTFKVASGDAGDYTCRASNSEGWNHKQQNLVVRYTPKDMKITGQVVVNEGESLTLSCTASSVPPLKSFRWTKDGEEETSWKSAQLFVRSVSPSDSGAYRCAASNDVGTAESQAAVVRVKYAPRHTEITQSKEEQDPDGRSYITLTCSTECYPPATKFTWYREEKGQEAEVSNGQTHTVSSDQPGLYYCVASNEIKGRRSDGVYLFDDTVKKALRLSLSLFLILLVAVIFVLVYRHRKKNSAQPGATRRCCCFLCWSRRPSRGPAGRGTFLAEPSRSRDDLLSERAQPQHPAPDSTPAPDVNTVYSLVNVPPQKQAAVAHKAVRLQGGPTEAHSPNYASLHFGSKTTNKQPQPAADDVYAKVCRSKPHKTNENEWLTDYENVGATVAAKAPEPSDDDDTSSDDDVQLNYAQVSFKAKPGRQRGSGDSSSGDSSSGDDYDVQYSDIKI
ncbi:B-cell receptor CD22 isoform X2 [Betta splendens]|uniref:B-cell receptor CD22 n=1 Tax=Betta splendens TaxID=158456 RepID=A0A9W2XBN7_BETSP|nr:B-cell receptor CD22 isoform X2 [Betta splendens]